MTDAELWARAGVDARDAANLLTGEMPTGDELKSRIVKIEEKLRSAKCAATTLQQHSIGVRAKLGD